jgi:hypothetical protein
MREHAEFNRLLSGLLPKFTGGCVVASVAITYSTINKIIAKNIKHLLAFPHRPQIQTLITTPTSPRFPSAI